MKGRDKIMILGTAGILTTLGFLNLNRAEDMGIAFLCFLSAVLFLYIYFGRSRLFCSFSEVKRFSTELILGHGDRKKSKWIPFQIGTLTVSVILLCLSAGFGIGRTIYHLVH